MNTQEEKKHKLKHQRQNYKKILTGKGDTDFYPHTYQERKFIASANSGLKSSITQKEFEKEILVKANAEEKAIFLEYYELVAGSTAKNGKYNLKKEYDEFYIENELWELPEVINSKTVSESDIEKYALEIKEKFEIQTLNDLRKYCDYLFNLPFTN